jgi:hypothetical protein
MEDVNIWSSIISLLKLLEQRPRSLDGGRIPFPAIVQLGTVWRESGADWPSASTRTVRIINTWYYTDKNKQKGDATAVYAAEADETTICWSEKFFSSFHRIHLIADDRGRTDPAMPLLHRSCAATGRVGDESSGHILHDGEERDERCLVAVPKDVAYPHKIRRPLRARWSWAHERADYFIRHVNASDFGQFPGLFFLEQPSDFFLDLAYKPWLNAPAWLV